MKNRKIDNELSDRLHPVSYYYNKKACYINWEMHKLNLVDKTNCKVNTNILNCPEWKLFNRIKEIEYECREDLINK